MAQAIRVLRESNQGILKGFEEATADFLAADRKIHLHDGERVLYYSTEMLNLFVRYDGFTRDFAEVCQKAMLNRTPLELSDPPTFAQGFDDLMKQARGELQINTLIMDAQIMLNKV